MSRRSRQLAADSSGSDVASIATVFAALGDDTRLRLVTRLCQDGPQSIARLTGGSNISRQAIAKHLQALRMAGLARNSRVGREQIWQVDASGLSQAQRHLASISDQWDSAALRLQEYVEADRH